MLDGTPQVLEARLPDHFSFSAATTFQDCPKRWKYLYLEKAPREFCPSSFVFGSALHAALEMIHFEIFRDRTATLDQAIGVFSTHFARESSNAPLRFNKGESQEGLLSIATDLLREYLEVYQPERGSILAIEERVSLKLPSMSVPIEGRVDLLVQLPQQLLVIDAKTSKTIFSADKVKLASAQLALYASAYRNQARFHGRPVKGRFVVFRKLKFPRIDIVDVDLEQTELNRSQRTLSDTWALIQSAFQAGAFPARRSWACKQCPFQRRCDTDSGSSL